jgi:hypothetical protein
MAIRIIIVGEDRSAPAVFCDHCQERIARAEGGNVEWRGVDVADPHFTHRLF